MSEATEIKNAINLKTTRFAGLCLATCGIYFNIWIYNNTKKIEEITKTKIFDTGSIISLLSIYGWGAFLVTNPIPTIQSIGGPIILCSYAMYAIWAFKARKAIQEYALNEHKLDLRMNPFYTFIFNAFYINYCINDLPELKRKQTILSSEQFKSTSAGQPNT